MRPALRAGLLPLWRDADTIQVGIDPRRGVALAGMNGAFEVIGLLDGSRDRAQVVAEASRMGIAAATTERVIALLAAAGVLVDFPTGTLRDMPHELRRDLQPELAAASLARQDGDGGMQLLARRSATCVAVYGSGRIASTIIELLTCAGLAVHAQNIDDPVKPAIGGVKVPSSELDAAVFVGMQWFAGGQQWDDVDLVHRAGIPHLAVSAGEAIGVVGPLVQPGRTACLRCLNLTRADRDPAWPLILAQLATRAADPAACDACLATAVAAQAAAQVTAFVDQAPLADATVNGTLELALPAWQWRRRTWLPHSACVCRAAEPTSGC
jgi:hypothetical protein